MRGNPRISVRIDRTWLDQLTLLAREQHISVSELIREIIYAYLGGE